jgi:hypothetical protein
VIDLPTDKLPVGNPAVFTLQWDADGWEGVNYSVTVE